MISLISDDMMICVFSSVLYMAPRGRSVYPPGSQGSLVAGPPDEAATRHLLDMGQMESIICRRSEGQAPPSKNRL